MRATAAATAGAAVRERSTGPGFQVFFWTAQLRAFPRPDGCLHVFVTRDGNPYTDSGFSSTWQRALVQAIEDKVISRRFTFHDLRAYYTTQHKAQYGALPELHADAKTTAKVYDRSRVSVRKGLG